MIPVRRHAIVFIKSGRNAMDAQHRRPAILTGIVVAFALGSAGVKAEDKYPSRPVRIVVSFSAGGPTDTVARVMGAKMGDLLGQQFVVENKVGAGGNIGADLVAKAAPDGYTLLMATVSTHAINPGLYKNMPYDPVRDFAPIGQIGVTPTLLGVHPSVPATDVKSLVAVIKENPGKFTYGSAASAVGRDPRDRRGHGDAHAGNAGVADVAGAGVEGLRVLHLECNPGTRGHAAVDRRSTQRGHRQGARRSCGVQAAARGRHRSNA